MLKSELDELGRSDELTAEAIQMLINDESFFYAVFEGPLSGIREGRTLLMRRTGEREFQEVDVIQVQPW